MGSFLIWNSNSLKPTTEGSNKGNYIYGKLKELSDIDVNCLVETHLINNCEDNSRTSQEQIFPCQSIKDLSVTHHVKHTGCKPGDTYAGVSLIIRNNFEILKPEEIHKGRIIKMGCKNKATQTLQNIIGFYGYPSSRDKNDRKVLVKKLELALSDTITNYVLGDFNFTESQLDRSRPSKSTVENDRDVSEIWAKIRDKYELVDSFRILNPKLRRYSYVKNNAKSRIDRTYITEGESGKI